MGNGESTTRKVVVENPAAKVVNVPDTPAVAPATKTYEIWSIGVLMDKGKTRLVHVSANASVDVLLENVAKLLDLQPTDVRLLFANDELQYGSGKTLTTYKMQNGSTVTLIVRAKGGVWPLDSLKTKKYNLQPLLGYITVTTSEDDEDMITLENDPYERRAKMPCGHVIGPASMTSYCHSLLSQGLFQFTCPQCGKEWPYFLVRHVACLTGEEMKNFEEKIAKNYLAKAKGIITCPGCQNWCFRDDTRTNRMRCVMCAKLKKDTNDFCWICAKSWINFSGTQVCGNADCDGVDQRIRVLANCPLKKIREVELPSVRGCPKCGYLIEHTDACKHMTCVCKHAFCFACLKPIRSDGKWDCSTYGNECGVAPRQTSLPGC